MSQPINKSLNRTRMCNPSLTRSVWRHSIKNEDKEPPNKDLEMEIMREATKVLYSYLVS